MPDIEQLLFRTESESIDFKSQWYADDSKGKSELVKDILAFANSWREGTAYILFGVEEADGKATNVIGVAGHPKDADLQQLLKDKATPSVQFGYYPAIVSGIEIGVLEIPRQVRPVVSVKDIGVVKANTVYVRRGSSTDTAGPTEIGKMAVADLVVGSGALDLQFASDERHLVGRSHAISSVVQQLLDSEIPDYSSHGDEQFLVRIPRLENRDFFRELVQYFYETNLLRPVFLTVSNTGTVSASNVHVELQVDAPEAELVVKNWFRPQMPHTGSNLTDLAIGPIPSIGARLNAEPRCEVERVGNAWHLSMDFPLIQPGRIVWPPLKFWIGGAISKSYSLKGKIVATGLPAPIPCELRLDVQSSTKSVTLDELDGLHAEIEKKHGDD